MIVAVTGGTGFIGQRLVGALLAAGHEVRVLTRRNIASMSVPGGPIFFCGDLTKKSDLSAWLRDVDVLFNCAGEISDPARMEDLHVLGTERLADVVAGKVARWVQLSSTGAYGCRREGEVYESDELSPVGLYEKTKAISDGLVCNFAKQGAFEYVILRPSIVFGAGMPNRSLYAMLKTIEKGLFFFIGRPGASANYIHVDNVVHALLECGFRDEALGQTFNLSDHCTMECFVEMMALELGVKVPIRRLPEWPVRLAGGLLEFIPGWPLTRSRVDALTSLVTYPVSKIERQLQYFHVRSMAEGVADLVHFYRGRAL